jgi:hypothetical protein
MHRRSVGHPVVALAAALAGKTVPLPHEFLPAPASA